MQFRIGLDTLSRIEALSVPEITNNIQSNLTKYFPQYFPHIEERESSCIYFLFFIKHVLVVSIKALNPQRNVYSQYSETMS